MQGYTLSQIQDDIRRRAGDLGKKIAPDTSLLTYIDVACGQLSIDTGILHFSDSFSIGKDIATTLLQQVAALQPLLDPSIANGPIDKSHYAAQYTALQKLNKVSMVLARFNLKAQDLS